MSIATIDDEWLEFLSYKPKPEDEEEESQEEKIDEEDDREFMFQMVEEDA